MLLLSLLVGCRLRSTDWWKHDTQHLTPRSTVAAAMADRDVSMGTLPAAACANIFSFHRTRLQLVACTSKPMQRRLPQL